MLLALLIDNLSLTQKEAHGCEMALLVKKLAIKANDLRSVPGKA